MIRILAAAFALFLFAAAPADAQEGRAGMGSSSARPSGAPWSPPEGVTIAAPIRGYSVFMPGLCPGPEEAEGSGDLVRLCIAFRYARVSGSAQQTPIRISIPAGTIFISEDLSTQNGIVVKHVTREIRPGQTIYIPLYLMCLNDERGGSSPESVYIPGPVTREPGFISLFERLADKQIPQENAVMIQSAVWALSEGDPIAAADLAAIDALPEA